MIRNWKRMFGGGAAVACCALLFACTGCASQVVASKGPRPPASATDVKLYQTAPKKYEMLGIIKQVVTPDMRFDARGESTAGFDRLKALAAEKGANGLLLVGGPEADARVTAGYHGMFYQVPMTKEQPRTALGQAIFVLEP